MTDEAIAFALEVIDSSGVAASMERSLAVRTGRPRQLGVRALLVALFLLALDGRPLHLKGATKLLFCLPEAWRQHLGINRQAGSRQEMLARYRQVRYLFHKITSVVEPGDVTSFAVTHVNGEIGMGLSFSS